MPIFSDTIVRGVELIEMAKPDSEYLNDGKRLVLKQKYIITSFDSALYYLPPMEVEVGGEVYQSNPLALKVYSFPVDTLHPDQFFGPKDVLTPRFVWSDWYLVIACIVLFFSEDGTVDGKSNYETFSGVITVNATDLLPQDSFGCVGIKDYISRDETLIAASGI